MTPDEILHAPFENKTVLGRLYEAWHRLPACNLLAAIGNAIQEIQAYEADTMRTQQDVEHNLQQTLVALGAIRAVNLGPGDDETEMRELRMQLELFAGRLAKLLAKRLAGNVQAMTMGASTRA